MVIKINYNLCLKVSGISKLLLISVEGNYKKYLIFKWNSVQLLVYNILYLHFVRNRIQYKERSGMKYKVLYIIIKKN